MAKKQKEEKPAIKLVVGLGNPTEEYDKTRHNAGFMTVDFIADELGANYWKEEHGALVAHVKHKNITGETEELLLAKPQSYMNSSGGPVSKLLRAYKLTPANLLVIHDDMDLEPETIRIKVGGGNAGHNGLKSICAKLNSKEYTRVRIGIGHPKGTKPVIDFVLSRAKGKEFEGFEATCELAARATIYIIENGADAAMNTFN